MASWIPSRNRCLHPKCFSVVCTEACPSKVNSVTSHDGLVERQAGLRAIPENEFIDGMPITALGFRGAQASEDGCSGLLKIGPTEPFFGSSFFSSVAASKTVAVRLEPDS